MENKFVIITMSLIGLFSIGSFIYHTYIPYV
jgi:hypothetical protein